MKYIKYFESTENTNKVKMVKKLNSIFIPLGLNLTYEYLLSKPTCIVNFSLNNNGILNSIFKCFFPEATRVSFVSTNNERNAFMNIDSTKFILTKNTEADLLFKLLCYFRSIPDVISIGKGPTHSSTGNIKVDMPMFKNIIISYMKHVLQHGEDISKLYEIISNELKVADFKAFNLLRQNYPKLYGNIMKFNNNKIDNAADMGEMGF